MNPDSARDRLDKLKRRYLFQKLAEISMQVAGTALLIFAVAALWTTDFTSKVSLAIFSGLLVFIIRFTLHRLYSLENNSFTRYLNGRYPQLKESADLLLRDETELSRIQQLQKSKVLLAFNLVYPEIKLPNYFKESAGILVGCAVVYLVLSSFALSTVSSSDANNSDKQLSESGSRASTQAHLQSLSISVVPPAYTGVKVFESSSNDINVPEGSGVSWRVIFSGSAREVKMIFSGRDSVNLSKLNDDTYSTSRSVSESGFYQVSWRDGNGVHMSDFFKIETIKDLPPKVAINNLGQFTKMRFTDKLVIGVKSSLADDYGLTDAQIIATVSKGSGEGVKFREEKLRFSSPANITGKQVQASLDLDLRRLGLGPGDELYFYVEAIDNKTPTSNLNRTETFFIALLDTATEIVTADSGLGVDLMPEYFRSQRQIIIDTEKLLKERKQLTKSQFNFTSNELGYDQKALRLRYGQFLGEEEETIPEPEEDTEQSQTVDGQEVQIKQPGHEHDTENEHNLVDDKKAKPQVKVGQHAGVLKDPNEQEDPIKKLTHEHDTGEEATFFVQSIKIKLKAALTLMWDAELHLRMYDPAKSLPYQYKVLNLLKEISNDSRIYVHRTGFDPPPLKEEKRLTADLGEVKTSTDRHVVSSVQAYPAVRQALELSERMLQQNITVVSPEASKIFYQAGRELSIVAIEQPGIYLKGLSLLKSLAEQQVGPDRIHQALMEVRKTLWNLMPESPPSPSRRASSRHGLDEKFLKRFEELRHE